MIINDNIVMKFDIISPYLIKNKSSSFNHSRIASINKIIKNRQSNSQYDVYSSNLGVNLNKTNNNFHMNQTTNRVFVVGVGMTKFMKPGRDGNPDYPQFGAQAVNRALRDANLPYAKVQAAAACYVYGDSTSGQRVLYEVGMTGIPIYNIHNNCSTGSSGIQLMANMLQAGLYDCTLAIGFDKMERGSLDLSKWPDRTQPLDLLVNKTEQLLKAPPNTLFAPRIFGNAGIEHMQKYASKPEHMAKIAQKNHLHSVNNPYSQFRDKYTLEQIMKSTQIYGPLTKLQCCPTSDGAAAAILCSERFMLEHNLQDQAVEILGISLTTDDTTTFSENSMMKLAGYGMSKRAADEVYRKTGVCPMQVGVAELHDCFSANELITYEAVGLCGEGKAGEFIDKGDNTYGGRVVCNPSGGLISKGHPLGATGLAQCSELCWQLRGMAGKRQVSNLQYALQHNIGLGGACVVALYKKYNTNKGFVRADQTAEPDILEQIEKQQAKL